MKKTMFLILALVLVLGMLAGCGKTSDSAKEDAKQVDAIAVDPTEDDEGSFKGSSNPSVDDIIDNLGSVSLDDLNTLDEDSEGSFKGAARVPIEDMQTAGN